ncbi:hypothetical protein BKA66DRAFT_417355 [Pyrenochaeta sp. MPI-SDFR-AT-0127]|nr:hypothetical protein BKA66DRAFT_417355 [Pyrenochaeta sp. MPI-SDFR-AT-0127]
MSGGPSDSSSNCFSPPSKPYYKPPLPYIVGGSFTAKRHQPPAPFGGIYAGDGLPHIDLDPPPNQVDWCLSHPPEGGLTISKDICHFNITGTLRTGLNCGAQILLTNEGVAKIFDPMYYRFHPRDFPEFTVDVTANAASDYSIEAAAYFETMGKKVQGSIMPKYHGSWTLEITQHIRGLSVTREVRMILIEYVSGESMLDVDPDDLNQEERDNIMRKLIEADYDLRLAGIHHHDLEPKNVILSRPTTSNYADPKMRLTLIDFAISTVHRIIWGGPFQFRLYNPCFYWAAASWWSMCGWLPYRDQERIQWVWREWGDSKGGKYAKVERNPDNCLGFPRRPPIGNRQDQNKSESSDSD